MSNLKQIAGIFCLLLSGTVLLPSLLAAEPVEDRAHKRVLIIGMDGTRPDALLKARTPAFDRLIREGAFTDQALILGKRYQKNDTISGPGWSSILTGVWADKHGVHGNNFKGKNYELFPHFFKRLKRERPDYRLSRPMMVAPVTSLPTVKMVCSSTRSINRPSNTHYCAH